VSHGFIAGYLVDHRQVEVCCDLEGGQMMKNWKVILPLPAAFLLTVLTCAQIAYAQDGDLIPGVSPWLTILATQGLAVLLVIWWIVKGYPDWVAANQKQQEQWRQERKDDNTTHDQNISRLYDKLTELTVALKQKPCLIDKEK
jgi:hypothetical protein